MIIIIVYYAIGSTH